MNLENCSYFTKFVFCSIRYWQSLGTIYAQSVNHLVAFGAVSVPHPGRVHRANHLTLITSTGSFSHTHLSRERRRVAAVSMPTTNGFASTTWSIAPELETSADVQLIVIEFTRMHTMRHRDYIKVFFLSVIVLR